MPHPTLGFPPPDTAAGLPAAADRLRVNRKRIAKIALQAAIKHEPDLEAEHGETMLRLFLRDYERHVEQLARAIETGEDSFVVNYGEWLVPIYRRRRVPMRHFMAIVSGLRDAAATVMTPEENKVSDELFERWAARLKHHGRLPGDHRGNPILRFFWKGAGIGDDKWV
jgi:hypothetical protein